MNITAINLKKILFIFGTRPEAIKMVPLILGFKKESEFQTIVCTTGQHKEMLDQVLNFFKVEVDFQLDVMTPNQTLSTLTSKTIELVDSVINEISPNLIFVQGDTTSAFVGSLIGYYNRIPTVHVEAGLRSNDLFSPFPEEGNRKMIGHLSTFHMAPTVNNRLALLKENITDNIFIVGNTVIDALYLTLERLKTNIDLTKNEELETIIAKCKNRKIKVILVTFHRRESFGRPMEELCEALNEIAATQNVRIIFPVHKNPNVRDIVRKNLTQNSNVILIEPVDYIDLVRLLDLSYIVLTDSGGIQEEAPALGKPVLVLREVTERIEGIHAGTAKLVGTDKVKIINEVNELLNNNDYYDSMSNISNPYGDGKTSQRIISIIKSLV